MGLTSYVGNAGMYYFNADPTNPGNAAFANGPFYPDSKIKMVEITDGTSNTLAFGEALGGPEQGQRLYGLTWLGAGCLPSYWDCQSNSATWFTFGSLHPGVVNFALCDGSVRSILKTSASSPPDTNSTVPAQYGTARWTAFQQAAGINDNQTFSWSELSQD
jgi:prepilin-type processing-associated H-X9-DG protein